MPCSFGGYTHFKVFEHFFTCYVTDAQTECVIVLPLLLLKTDGHMLLFSLLHPVISMLIMLRIVTAFFCGY